MQSENEIDFTDISGQHGNLGIILLQRPFALNALTVPMVLAIQQQLTHWGKDSTIKAVIIRASSGRAFCAGGDIRSIYHKKLTNDPTLGDFFREEYRLNQQIFHFQKPYIALLDGITMGGGAGISIHGSHRVATENLSFAMPETTIGYFPDIGASYFLPRIPHKLGYYLGLTGEHIAYQDCLALGLVDTVIASSRQEQLIQKLTESALPDKRTVTHIIQSFSVPTPESTLWSHRKEIETCFSQTTIENILHSLKTQDSEWCLTTADILNNKSPASLKIALRALREGNHLDFDSCMQMDEHLAKHFMNSHDFFEGIRAVVIDKDHNPQWNPASLELITSEFVDHYFK